MHVQPHTAPTPTSIGMASIWRACAIPPRIPVRRRDNSAPCDRSMKVIETKDGKGSIKIPFASKIFTIDSRPNRNNFPFEL